MRKTIGIVLIFVIWTLTSFTQQQDGERFARVINRLAEAMNKQDYAGIVKEYDAGMTAAFPLTKTTILFKNYESQYGKVTKVDSPQVKAIDRAICVMYFEHGAQDLTLYINEQEKIKGFLFTTHVMTEPQPTLVSSPAPMGEQKPTPSSVKTPSSSPGNESKPVSSPTSTVPSTPLVTAESKKTPTPISPQPSSLISSQPVAPVVADKQQTELYLPFKGTWTVIVGGEVLSGIAQSNLLQQQYAFEFSAKDSNGFRYKNDGKANEDYFGYGKEILAPANGTIVEVIDGIRDNSPGMRNPYAPIGNAIIIQHSNREYSVFSFLKQGSIRVKVGDRVIRGQAIAQCGNSGNATEPVVHYHLQDAPYLQTAKGKKFYFERALVTTEGKKELKLIHLPEVGEIINPEY
jgi:murein DD-endopeptidase MepM/ murein hydrolase activator NlpD